MNYEGKNAGVGVPPPRHASFTLPANFEGLIKPLRRGGNAFIVYPLALGKF
jgi:hypothetical protein